MKTLALLTATLLLTPSLFAAPAKGGEAVAADYPAWTGITPKNYISGRLLLSNADLRQRVATVVVEFDATKTAEQLEQTGRLAKLNGFSTLGGHGSVNWENVKIPRDILVIYVAHNAKDRDALKEGLKFKDQLKNPGLYELASSRAPIYEGVTYDGAPANGGKYPFVYVLGYEGKEALVKEAYDAKTPVAVNKAIGEQRKKLHEADLTWRPHYGYVAEPKHFKDIEKTLAKGKALDAVAAKIRRSVTSSDAETAKEAQMLYDGLQQTVSDDVWFVQCSCASSPHVAAYRMNKVLKYWPKMKKQMSAANDRIKANAAAQPLVKMYSKVAQWADPDFTCKNAGEAKKIVAELEKMKKALTPLKEDAKNIGVQNSALMVDAMLDELIMVIPAKVPQK